MVIQFSDEEIRSFLSNVSVSVEGERSLLAKLQPFIDAAERRMCGDFLGNGLFDEFIDAVKPCVAYDAIYHALPSLDVVLTPNGLATVGNSNLAPASSARSLELRKSVADSLFRWQDLLLMELRKSEEWRASEHGVRFRSTLWPVMAELCELDPDKSKPSLSAYRVLAQRVRSVENKIADNFISQELMEHLRMQMQADEASFEEKKVIEDIRLAVAEIIRTNGAKGRPLVSTVDFIRRNPEAFQLWHDSDIAWLYNQPAVFRNNRKSSGYFF